MHHHSLPVPCCCNKSYYLIMFCLFYFSSHWCQWLNWPRKGTPQESSWQIRAATCKFHKSKAHDGGSCRSNGIWLQLAQIWGCVVDAHESGYHNRNIPEDSSSKCYSWWVWHLWYFTDSKSHVKFDGFTLKLQLVCQ